MPNINKNQIIDSSIEKYTKKHTKKIRMPYSNIDGVKKIDQFFPPKARSEGPAVVALTASWCGYCKQMLPAFEQAGKASNVPFLNVEQTDANKPIHDLFKADGFPKIIKIWPADPSRMPVNYSGDRSAKSLQQFAMF